MLCPEGLVGAVTAAAIAISKELGPEDADLLAAVLTQLGDTLATLSAARERMEARSAGCAGPGPE